MNSCKKMSSFTEAPLPLLYKHNSYPGRRATRNVPASFLKDAYLFIKVLSFLTGIYIAYRFLPTFKENLFPVVQARFISLLLSELAIVLPAFAAGALHGWKILAVIFFCTAGLMSGFFYGQFEGCSVLVDACLLVFCSLRLMLMLLASSFLQKRERRGERALDTALLLSMAVLLAFIKLFILENFT